MSESNGITVSNQCFQCHSLNELCPDCQDERDTRDTVIAHQIVDEGNASVYRWQVSSIDDSPSGHEWISPLVRTSKGIREEFMEPTTLITDRIFEPNLEIADDEVVCKWCYLVTLSQTKCVNCDEVIE